MLKRTLNGKSPKSDKTRTGYVKHKFEFENKDGCS